MQTTARPETAAPLVDPERGTLYVYRSTEPARETPADLAVDARRRAAEGLPPRNMMREPAGVTAGPRYSLTPYTPGGEPYAVVRLAGPSRPGETYFGLPTVQALGPGNSWSKSLMAADVFREALAGRFGMKVVAGPALEDLAEADRERARRAEEHAAREKAEAAARRAAAEAEAQALAAVLTPTFGSTVVAWVEERSPLRYAGTELTPFPAVVFMVDPRDPGGPPPAVCASVLGHAGAKAARMPHSAAPRAGCWSWPDSPPASPFA